jgi:hypothetical protein
MLTWQKAPRRRLDVLSWPPIQMFKCLLACWQASNSTSFQSNIKVYLNSIPLKRFLVSFLCETSQLGIPLLGSFPWKKQVTQKFNMDEIKSSSSTGKL